VKRWIEGVLVGALGVAGAYAAYRWYTEREREEERERKREREEEILVLLERVKVSALCFANPWPPRAGFPLRVTFVRPTTERGFDETAGRWIANAYEAPYDLFVRFPREPRPSKGPDTYYYDKVPWSWYPAHGPWVEHVRKEVTSDTYEATITPRNVGWMLVLDVGWWSRYTIGPCIGPLCLPTPKVDYFACSGWERIC